MVVWVFQLIAYKLSHKIPNATNKTKVLCHFKILLLRSCVTWNLGLTKRVACLCSERTSPLLHQRKLDAQIIQNLSFIISGSEKCLLGLTYHRELKVHLFISKKIFNTAEASGLSRSQVVIHAKLVVRFTNEPKWALQIDLPSSNKLRKFSTAAHLEKSSWLTWTYMIDIETVILLI